EDLWFSGSQCERWWWWGGGDVSEPLAEKRPVRSERHKEEETTPGPSSSSSSFSPKKRLMVTASEKAKLLDWDLPATPADVPRAVDLATPAHSSTDQVPAMAPSKADPSQTDVGPVGGPVPDQTPAPPLTVLQLFANSFRKSFSRNRFSNNSNPAAAVVNRGRTDGPRKPRPVSDAAISFNRFFGQGPAETSRPRQRTGPQPEPPQQEAGKNLPAVLRTMSLSVHRASAEGEAFSDDMATLPRRRLNFFSSLRLQKKEASEGGGAAEETQVDGPDKIRTILANLRKKASSQQQLEESLSSGEEDPHQAANQKVSLDRQRRRQEKTAAQQAKRDQLKRLHKAQAIQRHLEEVGERQREVEERGVAIEKSLRGETGESVQANEENEPNQSWFNLVLEKNRLDRYE
ncbi:hypothetical protein CRUP_038795, partial [Coryphaenoides rupestris]